MTQSTYFSTPDLGPESSYLKITRDVFDTQAMTQQIYFSTPETLWISLKSPNYGQEKKYWDYIVLAGLLVIENVKVLLRLKAAWKDLSFATKQSFVSLLV